MNHDYLSRLGLLRIDDDTCLSLATAEDRGLRHVIEDKTFAIETLHMGPLEGPKPDLLVFGIVSSHRGKIAASFVSEILAQELARQLPKNTRPDAIFNDKTIISLFREAYSNIDRRITEEIPNSKDGASIVLVAHARILLPQAPSIPSNIIHVINLGDTSGFLCRVGPPESKSPVKDFDKCDFHGEKNERRPRTEHQQFP